MQETWVQSLAWEDPLEKEMATHSNILAWQATVHGIANELDMTETKQQESKSYVFSVKRKRQIKGKY